MQQFKDGQQLRLNPLTSVTPSSAKLQFAQNHKKRVQGKGLDSKVCQDQTLGLEHQPLLVWWPE